MLKTMTQSECQSEFFCSSLKSSDGIDLMDAMNELMITIVDAVIDTDDPISAANSESSESETFADLKIRNLAKQKNGNVNADDAAHRVARAIGDFQDRLRVRTEKCFARLKEEDSASCRQLESIESNSNQLD
jgi:hypothetical protein